ncbi:MAG TPA: hypothetical protein VMZ49_06615, partial [Patescibacteria group bacterium]|nr:hypothetical protein [Patescibacteria group bacterium]
FASEFQEAGFPGTRVLRKSHKMHNHLLQFQQILLKTPAWGKLIFLSVNIKPWISRYQQHGDY